VYTEEISIVGSGNVAFKLGEALRSVGVRIKAIYSRNEVSAAKLAELTQSQVVRDINELDSELILICVADEDVYSVIQKLPLHKKVAYTSGSVSINQFDERPTIGVFYPLQTLRQNQPVHSGVIPLLIESKNPEFLDELVHLGKLISPKVLVTTSDERIKYHLAAVWLNNFTNHMATISRSIIDENGLELQMMRPLLEETIQKLVHENPFDAQTGPARRGDERILTTHRSLLQGTRKEVYEIISRSISETYQRK
jgi:predicted short-subunit dehydrogenase-like oxidoreductase (DUF2520 family)